MNARVRTAASAVSALVLLGAGAAALAQDPEALLRSADRPEQPATVLPTPPAPPLPGVAAPTPLPTPPASIDDILDQTTDVEPDPGIPQAPEPLNLGLSSETLDTRIRGASAAAQGMQGPMDGAWSLQDESGAPLYSFQFVHAAGPNASLEGAWRDHKRGEGLGGTGLIAAVSRNANILNASFNPKGGAETAMLSLTEMAGGSFTGVLTQGGVATPVRLVRTEPMLNAEPFRTAVAGVVSPYRQPVQAAPPAPARKAPVRRRRR
jgi:hypothetical protein